MAGRPPKYNTPEEMQEAIDLYFETNPEYPTLNGLALELGFESRQSMYDYAKKEEFSYTIKSALSRIEEKHERNLYEPGASGSIFFLKNRDWTDKTSIDHTTKGESLNPPKTIDDLYDENRNAKSKA